jgi:hypothetical protein
MPQVSHVLHQDLELYLTSLSPTEDGSRTERHLSDCEPCVARLTHWADFSATLREMSTHLPDGREKRQHRRFPTNDSGVLQILNPFSVEYSDILIVDVSRNGMRVRGRMLVERGSLVKVRVKTSLFFGEVRYCESVSDGTFHVGLQLQDFMAALPTSGLN